MVNPSLLLCPVGRMLHYVCTQTGVLNRTELQGQYRDRESARIL